MNQSDDISVALDVKAELGEGLHWDYRRQCLWMVDIHGRRLIQWDLKSPTWREWTTPHRVGWVIPYGQDDTLLLGMQPGMARVEVGDELKVVDWIARPFGENGALRLNDAKADATGAVWAGSMNNDDESRSDGCLFRLAPDGALSVHDTGYNVANGPAISPDGKTLLHTDSGRRRIYAFDLDAEAGVLAEKRVWRTFLEFEGYPDGMCFDADGCVWVAHWGAGCVSRFDANARMLRRIHMPAPLITNVCVAGAARDRLFVSSARVSMGADALALYPKAGALFEILPGTKGAPSLTFAAA